jgi:catechol 2,3-dioxygenase-like lactoylglutathione lyase family enzyme
LLDHVFVTVKDFDRSIAFYAAALKPLGIVHVVDYNGKDGPEGHPDLKGFGRDGRVFLWLREGHADARSAHIGFVARGEAEVNAFYDAAMEAGAVDNGKPGVRLYYDPRYYAANVFDPDGYSLEAVYKSWQHPQTYQKRCLGEEVLGVVSKDSRIRAVACTLILEFKIRLF